MYKVVLVGKPNVGKSTLFNRLVKLNKAIVNDQPGVTRDRKYGEASIADLRFILIDTAGIDATIKGETENQIKAQTESAIDEAHIIILVLDGRVGVLPDEKNFSKTLIKTNKPVIVLINKSEGKFGIQGFSEATSLGFDCMIPFSAEHGEGLSDLYDALGERIKLSDNKNILNNLDQSSIKRSQSIRVSIIGKPNTGKSTLLNNLIGYKRVVTGPEAGITRDSIEVLWKYKKENFCLVDTAGLRRKSKINANLEKNMVSDTLKTIKFSNICVLLIDASKGFEKQDLTIARMIINEGRGLIVGVNMWDKVFERDKIKQIIFGQLKKSLSQIKNVPVVFLSGLQNIGFTSLIDTITDIKKRLDIRIVTSKLNKWLIPLIENNPAPLYKGKKNNIKYITQVNIRPPTFAIFMSSPEHLPESYKRFLSTSIKEKFHLSGLPVRILLRKGNNPYLETN